MKTTVATSIHYLGVNADKDIIVNLNDEVIPFKWTDRNGEEHISKVTNMTPIKMKVIVAVLRDKDDRFVNFWDKESIKALPTFEDKVEFLQYLLAGAKVEISIEEYEAGTTYVKYGIKLVREKAGVIINIEDIKIVDEDANEMLDAYKPVTAKDYFSKFKKK